MDTNIRDNCGYLLSTSLWGRELKGSSSAGSAPDQPVDLLVRSWIERALKRPDRRQVQSTSLWGRELKDSQWRKMDIALGRPPCEVVNWKIKFHISRSFSSVDLLVRSWIERPTVLVCSSCVPSRPPCEVVNWKISSKSLQNPITGRPPCEVVNWKTFGIWI